MLGKREEVDFLLFLLLTCSAASSSARGALGEGGKERAKRVYWELLWSQSGTSAPWHACPSLPLSHGVLLWGFLGAPIMDLGETFYVWLPTTPLGQVSDSVSPRLPCSDLLEWDAFRRSELQLPLLGFISGI